MMTVHPFASNRVVTRLQEEWEVREPPVDDAVVFAVRHHETDGVTRQPASFDGLGSFQLGRELEVERCEAMLELDCVLVDCHSTRNGRRFIGHAVVLH